MTTNTPATPTPPPGSPEAVAAGCLCPILDNAHGRGIEFDTVYRSGGDTRLEYNVIVSRYYWCNPACPLHGHGLTITEELNVNDERL